MNYKHLKNKSNEQSNLIDFHRKVSWHLKKATSAHNLVHIARPNIGVGIQSTALAPPVGGLGSHSVNLQTTEIQTPPYVSCCGVVNADKSHGVLVRKSTSVCLSLLLWTPRTQQQAKSYWRDFDFFVASTNKSPNHRLSSGPCCFVFAPCFHLNFQRGCVHTLQRFRGHLISA